MKYIRQLSYYFLLIFLMAAPLWAATGRLRGSVKDPAGKPLEGVTINIEGQEERKQKYTATTNTKGEYIHIGVAPGKYRITPVKEGLAPVNYSYIELQVTLSDRPVEADFVMQPKAQAAVAQQAAQQESGKTTEAKKALALLQQGKTDEGIALLQNVLKTDPKYAAAHYYLGLAYQQKKEDEEARKHLQEAIRLKPDFGEAYQALGENYMSARIFDSQAIDPLTKATELMPKSYAAFYNLGVCYSNSGKYAEAEAAYRKAAELSPKEPVVHYQLGMALLGQSKNAEAKAALQKYLELNPTAADRKEVEELLSTLQ
jgi:tetratricopeptide (TPR) repeat protein